MSDQNAAAPADDAPSGTRICFKFSYQNMTRFAKFLQVFSSLLLLVIVILRLVYFLQLGSLPNYIMTFYFVVFAIYLLLFELGIMSIRRKFYLFNFLWGKAVFDFFLGCMIISAYVIPPIDVPATIFFFVTAIVLGFNSVWFRKEEKERIDKDLEAIRKVDEAREKKRLEKKEKQERKEREAEEKREREMQQRAPNNV